MLFIDLLKKAADVSYKKSAFVQFYIKESSYSLSDLYTYYCESILWNMMYNNKISQYNINKISHRLFCSLMLMRNFLF